VHEVGAVGADADIFHDMGTAAAQSPAGVRRENVVDGGGREIAPR